MSCWADDADAIDTCESTAVSEDDQTLFTTKVIQKENSKEIHFGSSFESSPLDVFVSNVISHPFKVGNQRFASSDDYMDTQKLLFDTRAWKHQKFYAYKYSIACKCEQYPDLRKLLLRYKDAIIIEISGHPFWSGIKGGKNKAGKALMKVAKDIDQARNQNSPSASREKLRNNMFSILDEE